MGAEVGRTVGIGEQLRTDRRKAVGATLGPGLVGTVLAYSEAVAGIARLAAAAAKGHIAGPHRRVFFVTGTDGEEDQAEAKDEE